VTIAKKGQATPEAVPTLSEMVLERGIGLLKKRIYDYELLVFI
jgi:hypothetical protein